MSDDSGTSNDPKGRKARILRTVREDDNTTSVYIDTGDDERFRTFRPGQFATLRVMEEDGWSDAHPFTIAAAPGETVRLTIRGKGRFTSELVPGLRDGDEVHCAGPYGVFCRDIERQEQIVLIAGGVGITPFLSVLRSFDQAGAANRVVLFWSNKTYGDAFAAEELEAMTRRLDLTVVHVLTRETNPHHYADQKLPAVFFEKGHISRDMLARHVQSATASFYLCGPGPMQQHVLDELRAFGVDTGGVETEQFVFS
ncbi:FAD/NAD-binding family oxidoreductase [Nitratidesulfovibrio sp. SRB-5]|uniref:FAD/NAD-binding family oxidoreductase n=1 Tax=Nitratidesulfovibrio sp. SRB-5 TaxID=2872636 RepID=UPI0010283C38|nr:FAD/NAD-binding family oxidoreductase [Nitratidesulfovibrio sp. SRB-5]MBZ2171184.1 FAD/NAD-binding family oxidoreductase [Nitratidesulfovibrio sp. SRB-5]RXF75886.1 FAD/NAD-binding family oxidoreductase [Desulfovibrio sp. DS-1]